MNLLGKTYTFGMLLAILALLPVVQLLKGLLPFNQFIRLIGTRGNQSQIKDAYMYPRARRLKKAMSLVNGISPVRLNCLTQATTTKLIAHLLSIKSTVYVGVKKGDTSEYDAHAWHAFDNIIISGGGDILSYQVMDVFQ
jgi:hypothetical protein